MFKRGGIIPGVIKEADVAISFLPLCLRDLQSLANGRFAHGLMRAKRNHDIQCFDRRGELIVQRLEESSDRPGAGVRGGWKRNWRPCSAGEARGLMRSGGTALAAHSRDKNGVRMSAGAFAPEQATSRDNGRCAEAVAMLMMLTRPRCRIAGPS